MPITSRAATRLHTVSAYVPPHVLRMPIEHQERIVVHLSRDVSTSRAVIFSGVQLSYMYLSRFRLTESPSAVGGQPDDT